MHERYSVDPLTFSTRNYTKMRALVITVHAHSTFKADVGVAPHTPWMLSDSFFEAVADRALEIEKVTQHDVAAIVQAMNEIEPGHERYVYRGLTSNDANDTALSILLYHSEVKIKAALVELFTTLQGPIGGNQDVPYLCRTHGQVAVPSSLGLELYKIAIGLQPWITHKIDYYGKLSGPVGNYENTTRAVEKEALNRLKLLPCEGSTQIVPRDVMLMPWMSMLTSISIIIQRLAMFIRLNAQTGIEIMNEGYPAGRKGSSSMPHKRNPANCEQICGLTQLVLGYQNTLLHSMCNQWGSRDIAHSCVERVAINDMYEAVLYQITKMNEVVKNLHIDRVRSDQEVREHPECLSIYKIKSLVDSGMPREQAYQASKTVSPEEVPKLLELVKVTKVF